MKGKDIFFAIVGSVAFLFSLCFFKDIIVVFLFSLILSAGLSSYIDFLKRKGLPRIISLLSIYFSFFILVSFLFYFFSGPVFSQLKLFILNFSSFWQKFQVNPVVSDFFSSFPSLKTNWQEWLFGFLSSPSKVLGFSLGVISNLSFLILSLILVFYLTVQERGVEKFFLFFVPKNKTEEFSFLWQKINKKIYRWFNAQILLCLFVGFLSFLFLRVFSVPYSLLLGVLAGILEIFPFIGPFIAGLIAILVASQKSLLLVLIVALGYLVIQQIESHIVIPNLMAKRVDLNPVVVIFFILVGIKLIGGIVGALVAIPLGLAFKEILLSFEK